MYRLGINFDELSDELDTSLEVLRKEGVKHGEIRTINKINFVNWSDDFSSEVKGKTRNSGIAIVGAASPLFKWYSRPDEQRVAHDNFGFDFESADKQQTIERALAVCHFLNIPVVRIFSGLGYEDDAGNNFSKNKFLRKALSLADRYSMDLAIENEPPCKVHTKKDLINLFNNSEAASLKLWLDVANMYLIAEDIDDALLKKVGPRVKYVHIKNFVMKNGKPNFVAIDSGDIDYTKVLEKIFQYCPDDLSITIETHAKENKAEASIKALTEVRKILDKLRVNYE